MNDAEIVARKMAGMTSARSETGQFVRMDGRFAVVNIGTSTVTIPCVGFYPPVAGMPVRVDWVNGSPTVTGPVRPLNPLGTITAPGTPRSTVSVDGVAYSLFYRDGYTPEVDDQVEINWTTGIIQGRVTGVETPTTPPESGGGSAAFDVTILAVGSGRFQPGSGWWGNDPWASNNNVGIWTYGGLIAQALGASPTIQGVAINLPSIQQVGSCSIGVHAHAEIPGGAPTITSLIPLSPRSGWVALPVNFGTYLALGGTGIGVTAPAGGNNKWRGIASDSRSGAIRLVGTR